MAYYILYNIEQSLEGIENGGFNTFDQIQCQIDLALPGGLVPPHVRLALALAPHLGGQLCVAHHVEVDGLREVKGIKVFRPKL